MRLVVRRRLPTEIAGLLHAGPLRGPAETPRSHDPDLIPVFETCLIDFEIVETPTLHVTQRHKTQQQQVSTSRAT